MNATTEKITKKHSRRADMLLIGGLVVIFAVLALAYLLTRSGGSQVVVRVSGQLVATYSINDQVDTVIDGKDGGTNRLIISDGQVWLEDATCPDKLCEGMGKICNSGDSIVCLPNQVVVEIHGDEDDVDVVAK